MSGSLKEEYKKFLNEKARQLRKLEVVDNKMAAFAKKILGVKGVK